MKKVNQQLVKSLSVAMLVLGANVAIAETLIVPASVTVNNAIDFTFTGTLDFGQVRAVSSDTVDECSGLTLSTTSNVLGDPAGTQFAAACTATGASSLQAVGGAPERPVFTIAGIAPFTSLTLEIPTTAQTLSAATGPGTPQFRLVDFTARKTSGTPIAITTAIVTDADGGATFTVGATLITEPTAMANTTYQDLAYTGNFDVSVDY